MIKIKDKKKRKGNTKESMHTDPTQPEDTNDSMQSYNEEFMNYVNIKLNDLRKDILNSRFQDSYSIETYTDNDDFIEWYKIKMKEITQVMDDLVNKSNVR